MTDLPTKDSKGNNLEKGVLYEAIVLGKPLPHPHLFQGFKGSDYLFETYKGEKTCPIPSVDSLIKYSQEELGHLFSEYQLLTSWIEKIRAPYIERILKEVRNRADRRITSITADQSEEYVRQEAMEDIEHMQTPFRTTGLPPGEHGKDWEYDEIGRPVSLNFKKSTLEEIDLPNL